MTFDGWLDTPEDYARVAREREETARLAAQEAESNAKHKAEAFKPLPPRLKTKDWQAALNRQGTDTVFEVNNQVFTTHKIKLMANSPYFNRLLSAVAAKPASAQAAKPATGAVAATAASQTEGLSTDDHAVIVLKDIDPAIFKILLEFIYTGTISNNFQEAFVKDINGLIAVLEKADQMEIDGFVQWSSDIVKAYLRLQKNPKNEEIISLLKFGFKSNSVQLLGAVCEYIAQNCSGYYSSGYADVLAKAICEASGEGLITKENWHGLNEACPYNHSLKEVLSNSVKYNPIIAQIVAPKTAAAPKPVVGAAAAAAKK